MQRSRITSFWFRPIDARVYELLRILYGLIALLNLLTLWPKRYALLSNSGMSGSPAAARDGFLFAKTFTLFRSDFAIDLIFGIAVIALICLSLGFKTRLSAALGLAWHMAYIPRIGLASSGSDYLLLQIGFFLLISPLGKIWALDAKPEKNVCLVSPVYGLRLIQIQVALMYLQTSFAKITDPDWQAGEATAYFFMGSYSSFRSSEIWLRYPFLSPLLTYSVLVIECALPFLLWNRRTRIAGFVLGYLFHGMIAFSILTVFSLTTMMSYWSFLDGADLEAVRTFLRRSLPRWNKVAANACGGRDR